MTEETTKTAPKARAKVTAKKTLVEALASFQADLPEIKLDGLNPHFKSKFATLANITREVFPRLAENGLAFSVGSLVDNGLLIVDAHLIHESGESRSMQIPITETNPQKIGSALSYYRRYSLTSLTGIVADEDDDGNAASAPAPAPLRNAQARKNTPTPANQAARLMTPNRKKVTSEWIDKGRVTKEGAIAIANRVKSELGLDGDEMYEEVLKRLEAGEVG